MSDNDRAKGEPLSDDALIAILRKEENAAWNWQTAELTGLRQQALNYYDRKPLGDEVEGQSRVITSEVADTVETVMPALMRVFVSGDDVVEFQPIEQRDEQAAKEASQYIPHVLMRQNDGFRIIHDWIKGALMYRLSGVSVDVEEVTKPRVDPVEGWTAEQMAAAKAIAEEQEAGEVEFDVEEDAPGVGTFSGTVTLERKKSGSSLTGLRKRTFCFRQVFEMSIARPMPDTESRCAPPTCGKWD